MNDKTRKVLPLVGALTLTASALLAGTGTALAAKPEPSIGLNGYDCTDSGGDFRFRATVDLSGNKGKWNFLEARLHVGGVEVDFQDLGRVENNFQPVEFIREVGTTATITVDVVTRKGDPTAATITTPPLVCPVS